MDTDLYTFLKLEEQERVETLYNELKKSGARHYHASDQAVLMERCRRLAREFIESLRDSPARFAAYLREIASCRIAEGFRLPEIQMALSLFEQEVWKCCEKNLEDREDLLKGLRMASWIIGNAKDELARTYLEQKEKAEADAQRWENRLSKLFAGT